MRCCKPRGPILHSLPAFFRKAQSAPGISGAIACHLITVLSKHGRDVIASPSQNRNAIPGPAAVQQRLAQQAAPE